MKLNLLLTFKAFSEMDYDKEKVDDMMLALLWLTMFDEGPGTRAWKGYNRDQ